MLRVELALTGADIADARDVEVWSLDTPGTPDRAVRAPFAGGMATVPGELPALWTMTIRRSADANVNGPGPGPDFRSRAFGRPVPTAGPATVNIEFSDGIGFTSFELTGWIRDALPATPPSFALPTNVSVELTQLTGAVALAPETLTVTVEGQLDLHTPAGTASTPFNVSAAAVVAPSNRPAASELLTVTAAGAPQVFIDPGVDALAGTVAGLVSGWVLGPMFEAFGSTALQRLPSAIARSLGHDSVPAGATFSLPRLTVTNDEVAVVAAMGSLTIAPPDTRRSDVSRLLWTQVQDIGPPARGRHAMVYDPLAKKSWLFGGLGGDSAVYGDTWSWDGEYWRQAQDIGPGSRWGHSMTFDPDRGCTVLFGGTRPDGTMLSDTWEWNGTLWSQVEDTGPSPRARHAAAYDTARKRWVLFGGVDAGPKVFGDTWEWDGAMWSQVADTGPLPGRLEAMMGYDATGARIVLVGGFAEALVNPRGVVDGLLNSAVTQTWEFDGLGWVQVADSGPEPCGAAAFALVDGTGVLHGGVGAGQGPPIPFATYPGTWLWQQRRWTKVQEMGPSPRFAHSLTYDTDRKRLILFGGQVDPYVVGAISMNCDTWESGSLDIPAPPPG